MCQSTVTFRASGDSDRTERRWRTARNRGVVRRGVVRDRRTGYRERRDDPGDGDHRSSAGKLTLRQELADSAVVGCLVRGLAWPVRVIVPWPGRQARIVSPARQGVQTRPADGHRRMQREQTCNQGNSGRSKHRYRAEPRDHSNARSLSPLWAESGTMSTEFFGPYRVPRFTNREPALNSMIGNVVFTNSPSLPSQSKSCPSFDHETLRFEQERLVNR